MAVVRSLFTVENYGLASFLQLVFGALFVVSGLCLVITYCHPRVFLTDANFAP